MSQSTMSFSLGPKWQARLERGVTMERVVWFLSLVLFLVAWNRGLHLLYGLFSFLISALILSYLGAAWQLRQLSVRLTLPAEAFCLTDTEVKYEVKGDGQFLTFNLDDPLQVIASQDIIAIDKVNSQKIVTGYLQFKQRGVHRFDRVYISSCYPFGLVTRHKTQSIENAECVVYPKISAIRQLPTQHLLGSQVDGDIPQQQNGGEEEFAMVRTYRQGDAMKNIHWRMSAKYSEWVVKEFDSTKKPFMSIVLNSQSHWVLDNQYDAREHMLEIVASIAEKCAKEGCGLKVILGNNDHYDVQPFQRDLQPLLYKLAIWNGEEALNVSDQFSKLETCPLLLTFSNSMDGPSSLPSLMPHQHNIEFRFNQDSYLGSGIKTGFNKRQEGRTTRIEISRTSSLWGVFS